MKKIVVILLLCFTLLLTFSCTKEDDGNISPISNISQEMNDKFVKYGLAESTMNVGMRYLFKYEWAQPTKEISVWIEEYRKGTLVEKPVEICSTDNTGQKGIIAAFIDESDKPKGTLLLSNEGNTESSAFLRDNTLDISYDELLNISEIRAEDLTGVERRQDIPLLLLIDGITIDVPDTLVPNFDYKQIVEQSNYALLLKCKFS